MHHPTRYHGNRCVTLLARARNNPITLMCLTLSLRMFTGAGTLMTCILEEPGSNTAEDYFQLFFVAFLRLSSVSNYTTTDSFHILSNAVLSNHPNHVHYALNRMASWLYP
jgi:hypothetical protein